MDKLIVDVLWLIPRLKVILYFKSVGQNSLYLFNLSIIVSELSNEKP